MVRLLLKMSHLECFELNACNASIYFNLRFFNSNTKNQINALELYQTINLCVSLHSAIIACYLFMVITSERLSEQTRLQLRLLSANHNTCSIKCWPKKKKKITNHVNCHVYRCDIYNSVDLCHSESSHSIVTL